MIKKQNFFNAIVSAFGVSVFAQFLGIIRQILIAAYFGISRGLDIYFMTYAMATLAVFALGPIFDTVSVPHLVKTLEEKGHDSFKRLTGSIFSFSVSFAFVLGLIFILIVPIAVKVMAVGFSSEDKKAVLSLSFYFLPWALIFLPYYALCSFYKSIRHFNIVFLGEIVISVFSILAIFVYHTSTRSLPIAYFTGYLAAFSMLFIFSFKYFKRVGRIFTSEMKNLYRNFIELFGSNQVGSLSSIVERFLQSFLPTGGISALAYSSQITANASGILSFRDIFLVPLSASKQRSEKLERAVIGLILVTVPIMLFCSYHAVDIVNILFKRGKFDINAAAITASALSIYMLTLLPATAGVPAFRMFQVLDRIKNTAIVYLFGLFNFLILGSFFTFYLKAGIIGLAWTVTINAYLANTMTFYLLYRHGIQIGFFRVAKYAVYSCGVSLSLLYIIKALPAFTLWPIGQFMINGCVYFLFIALAHIPIAGRLRLIIYGEVR